MIGIDLIDLQDPLLKPREKALRFVAHPSDRFPKSRFNFWYLWVAKEAIFKSRRTPHTPFSPLSIPVEIADDLTFSSEGVKGYIIAKEKEYLLAVCSSGMQSPEFHVSQKGTESPSLSVRRALVDLFLHEKKMEVTLEKDADDLPVIMPNRPVSFSHHGRFVAFAF